MEIKKELRNIASRSVALVRAGMREDENSVPVVLATETPAVVIDWDEWKVIREILLIDGVMQPEGERVVMLDNHSYRGEVQKIIKGSIENLRVENGEYRGDARFSSIASNELTLVREGHLTDVSVGYRVFRENTVAIKPGTAAEVNGRMFKNDFADKLDLYVRLAWQPLEGSLVPIGADERAKLERAVSRGGDGTRDEGQGTGDGGEGARDEGRGTREGKTGNNGTGNFKSKEDIMEKEITMTPDEILAAERKRTSEIDATAKRFVGRITKIDELGDQAKREGWSVERFNASIVERLSNGEQFAAPPTNLDLPKKDQKRYNIWNIIRSIAAGNPEIAAHERSISDEIAKRLGVAPRGGARGFFIEHGYLKREITIGTGSADKLVGVELMAANFMDLLYNALVFGKILGVKMIDGLVGNLDFPRKTSASTGYYIGESDAATESDINFGVQTMSPKTVSAIVKYSRQASLQSTPAMEGLVLSDVLNAIALAADAGMLTGDGTSNTPLGILNADGVQVADGAAFGYDAAVDMETLLANSNVNLDKAIWLTTPLVQGTLRKRKIETGQVEKLWMKNAMLERSGFATKQMPANTLALIEPSDIIIGSWGILEVQVNPLNDDGGVKVIPFWSHDILSRRGFATVKATNVS